MIIVVAPVVVVVVEFVCDKHVFSLWLCEKEILMSSSKSNTFAWTNRVCIFDENQLLNQFIITLILSILLQKREKNQFDSTAVKFSIYYKYDGIFSVWRFYIFELWQITQKRFDFGEARQKNAFSETNSYIILMCVWHY